MASTATYILSLLTILGQIGILLFLLLFFYSRKFESRLYDELWNFIKKNALLLAFILALSGVIASLYYSGIEKYVPCNLCWYQRIILFPQALIFGIALLRKDKQIYTYLLPLNILGILVSAYHYILQIMPTALPSCSIEGNSCSASPFFAFGYITIPMMVLTLFVLLTILCVALKGNHNRRFVG